MKLIILGHGNFGLEIEDIAEQMNVYESVQFLDDNTNSPCVLGKCSDFVQYIDESTYFYAAFGNNDVREKWTEALKEKKANLANIIHPSAYISPKTVLGKGIAVFPKAIINSYCDIKDGCIVNSGAIIDHHCILEPYVHAFLGSIVQSDNILPPKMNVSPGSLVEKGVYK